MKIYVLVGKSGTGKSYQAINICREKSIDSIIDDGLFIYKGRVIAGKSAKREATKIGAIKAAIFFEDGHMQEVKEAIEKAAPRSMLIIGTSQAMVEKIVKRLELGKIDYYIDIEEVTTEGEREIAIKQRNKEGKHVVPVPTLQLKRQFSGYFIRPLRIFRGLGASRGSISEKTVVRPTFSYLGHYIISDKVIVDIVRGVAKTMEGVAEVHRVITEKRREELDILVSVSLSRQLPIASVARQLQRESIYMVERMTAFSVSSMDIEVREIS